MGFTLHRGIAAVLAAGLLAPAAFGLTGIRVIPKDRRITAISSATDTDAFLFDGAAGGSLSVFVRTRSGSLNPTLKLFNSGGSELPLGGALDESGSTASIRGFKLTTTGTYSIVVGSGNGETGTYQLRLTARKLPASGGKSILVPTNGVNVVPFTGLSGGAVNFSIRHRDGIVTGLPQILSPTGQVVPVAEGSIRWSGDRWVGRRIPLGAGTGTYNLRLVGPRGGDPAMVDVSVRGIYSPGRATRVRLPAQEPILTGVSPFTIGPGEAVQATGMYFSPQARVLLSRPLQPELPGTVVQVSGDGTGLLFQVPADATGIYTVSVCNPEGQAGTLLDSISVENSGVPGSGGVSPKTGPAFTAGTVVTVTGAGFEPGITVHLVSGSTVTPVTVTYLSATEITFTTPSHPAGTVDIVLTNPGATPVPRAQAFTFTDVTTSRFFEDGTAGAMPPQSQSGDAFAGSRGAVVDLDGDADGDLLLQSAALLPAGASLRILHQTTPGVLIDATHGSIPDRFGGFDSAVDLGDGPGFAVGDLDGDSYPDLVLVSRGYVPIGDNTGTNVGYWKAGSASAPAPFAMSQTCGLAGDFPFFWNDFYSATRILKNDGNGNFFSSPFAASGNRRLPLVGFYVDGADAAYAYAVSYLATFQPQPDPYQTGYPGYFKKDPGFVDSGATGGERFEGDAVALGDLDGDGSLDIVVASNAAVHETGCFKFERGNGLAPFEEFLTFARPSTRVLLNGFTSGAATGEFKESAFPLFDPSQFTFPDTGYDDRGQAEDVGLSDLDGDGRLDIVLVSDRRFELQHNRAGGLVTEYRPGTRIFLNRGAGKFDDATRSNMPTVDVAPLAAPDFFAASRVALGDLNGDGAPDMVVASTSGLYITGGRPYTRILVNRDGTGVFDDMTTTLMPATAGGEVWQANGLLLRDMDRDGDLDLVLTTTDGAVTAVKGGTRVLINDGTGKFTEAGTGEYVPPPDGVERWQGDLVLSGDLNGDGFADLVISEDNPAATNATRILFRK